MNGFEAFWDLYPRRVGKAVAKREYEKAIKELGHREDVDEPHGWILERLREFVLAVAKKEMHFIPHPRTWLSQGRYDDDPKAYASKGHAMDDSPARVRSRDYGSLFGDDSR